ncbi:hypothetical protein ABZ552_25300 [Nocardia sp. NPDC019219]|uniref:hypothetical protein n=1 Tax=Nocardia sp. NPDC019219 TaxID=3154590 RepID=UPI0034102A84
MATEEPQPEPARDPAPQRMPEPLNPPSDALQREIRVASRNGRYALAVASLAAVAALLSSGVSAWASVHVSSTQIDRQERLAREQAIRTDRLRAYSDFATTYMGTTAQLAEFKGVLTRTSNVGDLQNAVAKVRDSIMTYQRSLATLEIVVSASTNAELAGIVAAQQALWEGPDSLTATLEYALNHHIATDENWPRVAAAGAAAIDKFVSDTALDKFVEVARKDVGSG